MNSSQDWPATFSTGHFASCMWSVQAFVMGRSCDSANACTTGLSSSTLDRVAAMVAPKVDIVKLQFLLLNREALRKQRKHCFHFDLRTNQLHARRMVCSTLQELVMGLSQLCCIGQIAVNIASWILATSQAIWRTASIHTCFAEKPSH